MGVVNANIVIPKSQTKARHRRALSHSYFVCRIFLPIFVDEPQKPTAEAFPEDILSGTRIVGIDYVGDTEDKLRITRPTSHESPPRIFV
jgi:hypothetical protein